MNFPEPPYPDQIICPEEEGAEGAISLWSIISKVRIEACMWVRSAFLYLPKTNLAVLILCQTFYNVIHKGPPSKDLGSHLLQTSKAKDSSLRSYRAVRGSIAYACNLSTLEAETEGLQFPKG